MASLIHNLHILLDCCYITLRMETFYVYNFKTYVAIYSANYIGARYSILYSVRYMPCHGIDHLNKFIGLCIHFNT